MRTGSDPYPDAYLFQVTTGRNSSRDSYQHGNDNIKKFLEKIRNSFYLRKLVSRKVPMLLHGRVKMETYFRNRR